MAGKLMFKLTGGKTDKDEEYEQLKEEFLKYKKACEGVKSHSGKLYEHTISYAKRYLGFAEETEKFFEQAGGREGQGFKVMGEEIMELAKQLASAVGEVTAGVEVMINTNEGLRKRISGRDDVAVDLGYATKSKDKDAKHGQKYDEARQKYEEVNTKLKIDLKAALSDGQPKFREHYQRLIAAQQAFYKGLERAATRLAEAEERYGSSSSRREVPIKEVPIKEVPIKEPPKPREVPIARDRAASKSTSNLKVSIVNARKLKAADLNGKSDPYCRIKCGSKFEKTKHKNNTLNPDWNEDFVFPVDPSQDTLIISLYDHDDIGSDDSLGSVNVSHYELQKLVRGQYTPMTLKVDGGKGEITIGLTAMDFGLAAPPVAAYQPPPPQPYQPPAPVAAPVSHSSPREPPASIKISIIHARKLKAADLNGKSDPYVRVQCGHKYEKTKRKDNTLNPDWNEEFVMNVDPTRDYIILSLFDHDTFGKDDSLGTVTIPPYDIQKLVRGQRTPMTLKIDGGKGDLHIALTAMDFGLAAPPPAPVAAVPPPQPYYAPPPQPYYAPPPVAPVATPVYAPPPPAENGVPSIKVSVIHARKIKAADLNGKSDPYVRIQCGHKFEKTRRRDATLNPDWNEDFVFPIDITRDYIIFTLYDHDTIGKDDPLGTVTVAPHELQKLVRGQRTPMTMKIDNGKGDLHFALTALDFGISDAPPPVPVPAPYYPPPQEQYPPYDPYAQQPYYPPPPQETYAREAYPPPPPPVVEQPPPQVLPPRPVYSHPGAPPGLTEAEAADLRARFAAADRDGSGRLELSEVETIIIQVFAGRMQEANCRRLAAMQFRTYDKDRSGSLDLNEFFQLYVSVRALGGLAPLENAPPPATPPRPETSPPPVLAPRPSYNRPSQAGSAPPSPSGVNAAGQPPPPLPARTSNTGAPPATNPLPLPPRSSNPGAPPPKASPKPRGVPPPAGLTDADIEDAQSRFRHYDKDQSGKLDLEETIVLLTDLMRGKLQEGNLRRLASMHFQSADKDRSGTVDFQEFLQLYAQMKASAPR